MKMKKIMGGVLFDTDAAREICQYREETVVNGIKLDVTHMLYRQVVVKPGVKVSDARKQGTWNAGWHEDKIDSMKGRFFMRHQIGWNNDQVRFENVSDADAMAFIEKHSGQEEWRKCFGVPEGETQETEITALVDQLREARESRDYWQSERDKATETRKAAEKERDELKAKVDEFQKGRVETDARLDEIRNERDGLKDELDATRKERDELKSKLDEVQQKLDEFVNGAGAAVPGAGNGV